MSDYLADEVWNTLEKSMKSAKESLDNAVPGASITEDIKAAYETLTESLEDVKRSLAFEDRGWSLFYGSEIGENDGITLDELHDASGKIRKDLVGIPTLGRAAELRALHVWAKGVIIPGTERSPGRGAPSSLRTFFADRVNQENLFSDSAHIEMEHAAATDGNFLLLGENSNKRVRRIPIHEIHDVYVNPDFPEEVWAYRRVWNPGTNSEPSTFWYYTDRFTGTKASAIRTGAGAEIDVDDRYTVLDLRFNRQIGWPLGIPDLVSAVPWARLYTQGMKRGDRVQEALSRIIFKATANTPQGVNTMAVKIAGATGAGNTLAGVQGNDITPLATAGRGYDFSSLQPIAAMVAQAAGVDVVNLLASPGAAGSSYGAAAVLSPSTKRTAIARQNLWKEYLKRVIRWATGSDAEITFPEIDEIDQYRATQASVLAHASGLIHDDEARADMLAAAGIVSLHDKVPDFHSHDVEEGTVNQQTAAPDQGRSTGAGRGGNSNDLRSDKVSETLNAISLDRLEELVIRMENAANK